MGWTVPPSKSSVGVLIPRTPEGDCMWMKGLYRGYQVKERSLRWTPLQSNSCGGKRRKLGPGRQKAYRHGVKTITKLRTEGWNNLLKPLWRTPLPTPWSPASGLENMRPRFAAVPGPRCGLCCRPLSALEGISPLSLSALWASAPSSASFPRNWVLSHPPSMPFFIILKISNRAGAQLSFPAGCGEEWDSVHWSCTGFCYKYK